MKKLKKVIIVLLVFWVIVLICILTLYKSLQQKLQEDLEEYEPMPDVSTDSIKELGSVEGHSTFLEVEKMLENFIHEVKYNNKQAVYNLIDNTYILEKNITQENVLNHISDIAQYASEVKIRKIYEQQNNDNAIYYIYCILEKEHKGKDFYFTLYKDYKNLTYSVEQIDKETFEEKIINRVQELEEKRIEKNDDNKTIYINPTEKEIVTKYFEDFLYNMLYYPDYAYSLLNSSYRNMCFTTLQDFKQYIENKREALLSYYEGSLKTFDEFETMEEYSIYLGQAKKLEIKQYQIRMNEEYNRYICIDSVGNYYTFYATSALNYTVVLGNYAIPTEDFIQTYNESSEVEKVVLNIKRFYMGIDDKNYGYSYSVLSESFKGNKYPTKDAFVQYAKQNFFEENEIEYISCEKQNGLYIYKIKIKDATGKNTETKTLNMIVKLNNGTDFEMSFGTD